MRHVVYVALLIVALVGTARFGLFVLNRMIFGQKHEGTPLMKLAILVLPPLLLALTSLFIPLYLGIERGDLGVLGIAGGVWLAITFAVGVYWPVSKAWRNSRPHIAEGVRSDEPRVIRLRKAHIPFLWLRKLGAHNDVYDLEVTRHEISIPNLPPEFDGYTIAFVTDTHVASFMRRGFYREVIEQINQAKTDVVLIGGDLVSFRRNIPLMAEVLITGLEPRDGIYAVLGNHDYWADADGIIASLTARGVRYLTNQNIPITRGESRIALAGIDEVYRGEPEVDKALRGIGETTPRIVVSHHPDIIDLIGEQRIDLLLCGHTHGGQIRLPFLGAIVVPSRHETLYDAGFFQVRNTRMYVSRGLGSVPPIRILCRPELALFVLRKG